MRCRSLIPTAVLAATILGGVSCGDATGPSPVTGVISQVTLGGLQATIVGGDPPAAAGFPGVQLFSPATMIEGGSAEVNIAAGGQSFDRVFIRVEGTPDYYRLTLPASVNSATLIVTLATNIPVSNVNLIFGLGSSLGQSYATQNVSVVQVAGGDVQVSVSWDVDSDLDLHLVEPGATGEEIFWGNPSSVTGGTLDLDSNPACAIDGVRNENIGWPTGAPNHGTYTVRLDHWADCGEAESRYVVTVRVKGHAIQTFTGTVTAPGDSGGVGSGATITTFSY